MKNHGIGIGYRPIYADEFLKGVPDPVRWIEVISENYMNWSDGAALEKQVRDLEKLRAFVPVSLHGVSMSLGSVDPLNASYLERLKAIVDRVDPFVVSDHLCFTGVDGNNLHDLLPLPYIPEAIDNTVRKIAQVQDYLGRRILIENVSSYLTWKQSEMSEWEFLSAIASKADCGILLDINNVYVSSVNHGFDPKEYLENIPHERVGQIHLAGHSVENGFLIDTHDEPVCDEVWNLLGWYHSRFGAPNVMVERDDNYPEWPVLHAELRKIQTTLEKGEGHGRPIADRPSTLSL